MINYQYIYFVEWSDSKNINGMASRDSTPKALPFLFNIMEELVKITTTKTGNFVSAKELYLFLGFDRSQWSRWYNSNIVNNQFAIEGDDYAGFDTWSNGNKTMDFTITIDFAKRLSMMAKTEKGEILRNYFIAREKQARELEKRQLPQDYLSALKALVKSEEQKQIAETKIKEFEEFAEIQYQRTIKLRDIWQDEKLDLEYRCKAGRLWLQMLGRMLAVINKSIELSKLTSPLNTKSECCIVSEQTGNEFMIMPNNEQYMLTDPLPDINDVILKNHK